MIYDNQFDATDDQTKKKKTGLPGEITDGQYGSAPASPLTNPIPAVGSFTPGAVGAFTPGAPTAAPVPPAPPTSYGSQISGLLANAPNVGVQAASPAPLSIAPPGTPTAGQTTPAPYTPTSGDATAGQGRGQPGESSVPAPTPAAGTPTDPTGRNRVYLGPDRDTGAPVWGDDQAEGSRYDPANVGQYDEQGNPKWNAALTGFGQTDYEQRAKIAKMSPAELQAFVSSTTGSDPASQRARDYAQGLVTAGQFDPSALKALTSNEAVYGQNITDPDYRAQHRVDDPTYDAELFANQNKERDALNAQQGYRTIQGEQTYTDPTEGQAAFDAIQAATNSEGSRGGASDPAGRPIAVGEPGGTGGTPGNTGNNGGTSTSTQTPYGPGNDLLGTQITPNVSDRQANANTLVDSAANAVGGGKSRGEIAQGYLDAFDTRAQPKIRDQIRAVGQRASSLGRLGMGDTAVEALNPFTDYLSERAARSNELASNSAAGDIGDRLNNLSALEGYQGQAYGQGVNDRGELRTERDFQNKMSRQAIEDAIMQYQLQQRGRQQEFDNGYKLSDLGYNNSPANLLFGAGGTFGQMGNEGMKAFAEMLFGMSNKPKTTT